jgi:hypothetical protein
MMDDNGEGCRVEQTVSIPPDRDMQVGKGVEYHKIAKSLAAKASTMALMKLQREEELVMEANVAVRKKSQKARTLESASKEHSSLKGERSHSKYILQTLQILIHLQLREKISY